MLLQHALAAYTPKGTWRNKEEKKRKEREKGKNELFSLFCVKRELTLVFLPAPATCCGIYLPDEPSPSRTTRQKREVER